MNGLYLQYEELWKVKYRKRWKEGEHCWQKSSEICDCSLPSWNFKDILSMVVTMKEYLSREEEIIVRNWKKKLKLKNCQKLQTILDEQEFSVQSAPDRTKAVHVWGLRIITYVITKIWTRTGHYTIYIWK